MSEYTFRDVVEHNMDRLDKMEEYFQMNSNLVDRIVTVCEHQQSMIDSLQTQINRLYGVLAFMSVLFVGLSIALFFV